MGMRFAIVENGQRVRYVLPWWRVAWAFACWWRPGTQLIRRLVYVALRGYPIIVSPEDGAMYDSAPP